VENEGFVNSTQVLGPRYKLPNKAYVKDVLILNLFKKLLSTMLEEISDISVTCDL